MRDTGVIDDAAYTAGVASPVVLIDSLLPIEDSGRYYREEVRKELIDRFGGERVYQGGLRVYTTLDPGMQQTAEREVARALGHAPATLAIAWCLRNPNVSSVILGASRVSQLLQNLQALEVLEQVDAAGWADVEAAFA